MKFLVTGTAGFIGSHVSKRLVDLGHEVIGIDNLNDYYDNHLKQARLKRIKGSNFTIYKIDLTDRRKIKKLFNYEKFDRVIHLAAQAGVRYSLKNPYDYIDSNLVGYLNILEGCRNNKVQHLLYASSSSVYGLNHKIPFSTNDTVDHPISFYAVTKKTNELMSHVYSYLYDLPTTGLRFFTVYGPWCRPDMALFKFTKAIIEGDSIDVYNYGKMKRDFIYIDDIIEVIIYLQNIIPQTNMINYTKEILSPATSPAPYRIYNIGNNKPIKLIDYITILEETLGIKAKKNMMPIQLGDLPETSADTDTLYKIIDFKSKISIKDGIKQFVNWYKNFYNI